MARPIIFTCGAGGSAYQAAPERSCAYCTRPGAAFDGNTPGTRCCALCHLPQHLARPEIDAEASLIWLPEMEQAVLSILVREMHMQLAGMNEPLRDTARPVTPTPARERIYHAEVALRARTAPVQARLGTSKPSDLGQALRHLAAAGGAPEQDALGGLRLLPRGQFFEAGHDIYPAIVADWRAAAATQPGA